MNKKINIAIFASGSGTNAENIANYFSSHAHIVVKEILSNKENAGVHVRAKKVGLSSSSFTRTDFYDESFLQKLQEVDYLILAGFLWLIPEYLVHAFPGKIINIHPALLPKFGGKGMYGHHVHQAVIDSNEKESGITIHLVNEHYDEGAILFQAKCEVTGQDNADSLAQKIHTLEYAHFPKEIERYVMRQEEKHND